jgi:hypothetical protein
MLPLPSTGTLITLVGDYFALFGSELPNGSAIKQTTMGQFVSSVRTVEWTGQNLVYGNSTGYLPTSGVITSYQVTYADKSIYFGAKNLEYIATTTPFNASFFTRGTDYWLGSSGNDVFPLISGNDLINGEGGIDKIKSTIDSTSYTIGRNSAGNLTLQNKSSKYLYTTDSIERLIFKDKSIAFDLNGNAGSVAKLLGAVFGKDFVREPTFMGIGLGLIDGGMSLESLVSLAADAALGAGYSNATLVNTLFKNIAGVRPTELETQLFETLISKGDLTRETLILAACDCNQNVTNIGLVGFAQTGIDYIPVD